MKNINFSKFNVETLDHLEIKKINGGGLKGWGWLGLLATEVVDVITSDGENLREAYNNGREAGQSLVN